MYLSVRLNYLVGLLTFVGSLNHRHFVWAWRQAFIPSLERGDDQGQRDLTAHVLGGGDVAIAVLLVSEVAKGSNFTAAVQQAPAGSVCMPAEAEV